MLVEAMELVGNTSSTTVGFKSGLDVRAVRAVPSCYGFLSRTLAPVGRRNERGESTAWTEPHHPKLDEDAKISRATTGESLLRRDLGSTASAQGARTHFGRRSLLSVALFVFI